MPTLNWIGKEAVVNHDKEVPFRLLKKVKSHSVGDSQNLIIKGDNLEGLKALMPYYVGKVKCIYIDPPYNTGNENWVYNDKVNSPKIKKWLGKVVGGEAQDLCRHDKWLCMMYPRLKLLRDLLSDDGAIFVSIDDNEYHNLKYLFDILFGEQNKIGTAHWRRVEGKPGQAKYMGVVSESVLIYAKNIELIKLNGIEMGEKALKEYRYEDKKGRFRRGQIYYPGRGIHQYSVKSPYGNIISGDFTVSEQNFKKLEKEDKIYWAEKGDHTPYLKVYLSDTLIRTPTNQWGKEFGSNQQAGREIKELFDGEKLFDTPKPLKLMRNILKIADTKENDIILDSFAGSGTTGHAVLDLNKEDGGNRKFILIEMEDDIAKKITAERIKRAIEKYDYKDGFEYCELDKPLFDENGQIEETCEFNQFATYIYFTETQTNIDKKQIDKNFIGESGETEYYLIYKEKYKNVLNKSFLSKLKKTKNKKVIYADFCMVDDDTLEKFNIQFKQIPYEVKVY